MKYVIYLLSFVITFIPEIQGQPHIDIKPIRVPVLKGSEKNPLFRLKIQTGDPVLLTSISLDLKNTLEIEDIEKIELYTSKADSSFSSIEVKPLAFTSPVKELLELQSEHKFSDGINYLWISCQIREEASLTNTISCRMREINFRDYKIKFDDEASRNTFRYGIALRKHNQDGVHTARIPGLATSADGTLLAIYDARRQSSRDLQGDIDIGLNRSFDGGETWEPIQIVLDMEEWGGLPEKFNGVSDACILVNGSDIYIAGLWMYGVINSEGKWIEDLDEESDDWNHQWRNKGSQPGFDPKKTSQFLVTKSIDDGKTWNNPINLTRSCKKEEWWLWAPAPGRGIVMEDGTLVFPTQGRDENGLPFSNITYSKDNGATWQTSQPASHNTTECSVVEYETGKLMLNIRDNRNRADKSETNGRAVFTTTDLGETWTEHPTSHQSLIEPVCMASLYKHTFSINGQEEVLLFSNPNSKYQREKQTLKMSFDRGNTWPENKWILLDEGKGRGYSCITSIDENTIGIVYEGSRADLIFQKIDLRDYLLDQQDNESE
jgi:sialidase-1